MKKFTFYSDAGHGWLKVPKALIIELGIADKISHFSYERSDSVYLEEDCDFPLFAQAYAPTTGISMNVISSNDSRVRTYRPYYPACLHNTRVYK